MFGYVRPVRGELKCKDFDLYRATYCGLCRCLRRRYGLVAPMLLSFDFVFLALLLWHPQEEFVPCQGRCHANPLVKKPMCQDSDALDIAADNSVILSWWKLRDSVQDSPFFKGLPARLVSILLKPAYKKAARRQNEFDKQVAQCLGELAALEQESCPSLDRTADTFARLMHSMAPKQGEGIDRAKAQLLYHLGRWIYLIDARDDLQEDLHRGQYNPVAARYGNGGDDAALALTLEHSLSLVTAAFALGEYGCTAPILENILYLGLPLVQRAVFDGSWAQIKNQKIWRKNP